MSKKLHLVSLGCTKNLVDSEVMLAKLNDYELTPNADEADVIIVNTCGFIESAKQESLNTIFDLHDERKDDSILVMSGCLSERYKEELAKELVEVDVFTGVGDYEKIRELIDEKKSLFSENTFLIDGEERVITGSNYHAYIKIAEGCNQKCSFCAIPNFRGKLISRSLDSIVDEVKRLVKNGFYDFSFISQDSSSYLRDKNEREGLIKLIDEIEKIEGLKSARILYLYPTTTSIEFIKRVEASPLFHNYFDIPIQHISDSMLKIMKRGMGETKLIELLNEMKKVENSFIRTSIIVGHPKESEDDFNRVCQFLREFKFDRVNIFAYSDEEGTPAYEMEDKIEAKEIERRVDILSEIVKKITAEKLNSEIGKSFKVIVDGESDEHEYLLSSRKLSWAPEIDGEILINDSDIKDIKYGRIYDVKITEVAGNKLIGRIES